MVHRKIRRRYHNMNNLKLVYYSGKLVFLTSTAEHDSKRPSTMYFNENVDSAVNERLQFSEVPHLLDREILVRLKNHLRSENPYAAIYSSAAKI